MNHKTYLSLPATSSIRPRRCHWLHHRLRNQWFPFLNLFLRHLYTWRLGHCCTWGWWPAGSSRRGRGGAPCPGCWRHRPPQVRVRVYFALHCTAPSCRHSAQDDTIAGAVGVWCSLLLGDQWSLTTVCLVSGETSSTLSARDESTANYDEAVELVHKNIK